MLSYIKSFFYSNSQKPKSSDCDKREIIKCDKRITRLWHEEQLLKEIIDNNVYICDIDESIKREYKYNKSQNKH